MPLGKGTKMDNGFTPLANQIENFFKTADSFNEKEKTSVKQESFKSDDIKSCE